MALDDPVATNLEAEDVLALDAPVATNLEAEYEFLRKKPRSDDWPLGFLGKMKTFNSSAAALMRARYSYFSQVRRAVTR